MPLKTKDFKDDFKDEVNASVYSSSKYDCPDQCIYFFYKQFKNSSFFSSNVSLSFLSFYHFTVLRITCTAFLQNQAVEYHFLPHIFEDVFDGTSLAAELSLLYTVIQILECEGRPSVLEIFLIIVYVHLHFGHLKRQPGLSDHSECAGLTTPCSVTRKQDWMTGEFPLWTLYWRGWPWNEPAIRYIILDKEPQSQWILSLDVLGYHGAITSHKSIIKVETLMQAKSTCWKLKTIDF